MKFTTIEGETIDLRPGVVLVIGWTRNGDAPAGTTHRTETVLAVTAETVILTGGNYRGGARFRVLRLHNADGRPTRQIRGRRGTNVALVRQTISAMAD